MKKGKNEMNEKKRKQHINDSVDWRRDYASSGIEFDSYYRRRIFDSKLARSVKSS